MLIVNHPHDCKEEKSKMSHWFSWTAASINTSSSDFDFLPLNLENGIANYASHGEEVHTVNFL